jgi:hypothetical protein
MLEIESIMILDSNLQFDGWTSMSFSFFVEQTAHVCIFPSKRQKVSLSLLRYSFGISPSEGGLIFHCPG